MKIDFYIFDTTSSQQSQYAVCRLIEKIYTEQQQPIYVNMDTREEAERFDALLWTYKDDSFLPHNLYRVDDTSTPHIQIGYSNELPVEKKILINFAQTITPLYQQFEHLIEIVFTQPLVQQCARERFKQYRDQGFHINTIKLKVNEND